MMRWLWRLSLLVGRGSARAAAPRWEDISLPSSGQALVDTTGTRLEPHHLRAPAHGARGDGPDGARLLSNAMKYGQGRPIEVSAASTPEGVCVRVRDEGIGISPRDQARIFGRFERAVSERHHGGLGLGLWISQQIVTQLGGHIRVESEQGRGSSFTVELSRWVED